jgi:hypothetical protein
MFLVKKIKNSTFWIFSIFLKSRDFAGFLMENWLYLGIKFNDFTSKTRFRKYIKFF